MPTVDVGDWSIHYRDYGLAEHPPLFLVHGLYGDSSSMATLATALAGRFRTITPDMLGHGRSSRPAAFTLADQGRALNGLVQTLGYDSAAVVGVSMGSYIAAQAAILEPARTSRLVLVVSKAHGRTSSTAAYAERLGIDLAALTPEAATALMADALWSPATPQTRRDEILATAAEQVVLGPAEQAAVERSLAGFDLRPALPGITAPTLVVSGRSDGLNPPEAGEEVAGRIPGARFVVYERSGHLLAAEETDRLAADTVDFVLC
jgi:3-oxoadipate enol-lactonase